MVVAATRRLVGLCAGAPGSDDRRSSRLHDFEATDAAQAPASALASGSRARRAGALSGFGEGSPRPRTSESRSNQPRAPRTTPRTDVLRVSPAPHAATRCLDHDLGGGSSRYLDNSLAFHSSAHPRERPRGALAGSQPYQSACQLAPSQEPASLLSPSRPRTAAPSASPTCAALGASTCASAPCITASTSLGDIFSPRFVSTCAGEHPQTQS